MDLTRRQFLPAAACCALPSVGLSRIAAAALPGDSRVVVILLRGAMDGLHLLRPYGDRNFTALRPGLGTGPDRGNVVDVGGFYGLAAPEGATDLADLWKAGELSFVQAVSTPYRGGRSHFDGQDILETGAARRGQRRDGWLPRMLSVIPGAELNEAVTLSSNAMLIGQGEPSVSNWSPGAMLRENAVSAQKLRMLYETDAQFLRVMEDSVLLNSLTSGSEGAKQSVEETIAATAAEMLRNEFRIAAFSVGGWDTHNRQSTSMYWPIRTLGRTLKTLRTGLGSDWQRTSVICVTEFGRSARENGVGGTDHGTGGLALLSGGAIAGGKVHGDWPGLARSDLYEDRDLRPTADIRAYMAMLFSQALGAPLSDIERTVFDGLAVETHIALLA